MFDLPDSYFQNTEVTDRISQLMQYTLLTVLELEFQPIYRQNWWERELKPHILQMDAGYDTFAGTDKQKPTVAKYRQLMNNLRHAHKVEPDLADLDVTALSTVLLYDDTYKDLDIRQYVPLSQKKYRSVLKVKNCRNGFSHGDVESRQQARDQGLQELRILLPGGRRSWPASRNSGGFTTVFWRHPPSWNSRRPAGPHWTPCVSWRRPDSARQWGGSWTWSCTTPSISVCRKPFSCWPTGTTLPGMSWPS